MSMYFRVWVGAYLSIQESVEVRIVDRCAAHDRPADAEYCPRCGESMQRRHYQQYVAKSDDGFWSAKEWIDHLVIVASPHEPTAAVPARLVYAISNFGFGGFQVDAEVCPLPDAQTSIDELLSKHADDIARLRELGCFVEAKAGVIGWWS